MLKRISLKNVDPLGTFNWSGEQLAKHNLIYGWNRSGKTTISRVLRFLEKRTIHISELDGLTFDITTDSVPLRTEHLASHACDIRVFNADFIAENLHFEHDPKTNKIVILGEDNIELRKELDVLTANRQQALKERTNLEKNAGKFKRLDGILTAAGTAVVTQFQGTPLASQYGGRSYRSTSVARLIDDGTISVASIESLLLHDPTAIDALRQTIKSEKSKIGVTLPSVAGLSAIFDEANHLIETTPPSAATDTLTDDTGIRLWIEEGYQIHKENELETCQLCDNSISPDRMDHLSTIFTTEIEALKTKIDDAIRQAQQVQYGDELKSLDSSAFYHDATSEYVRLKGGLEGESARLQSAIDILVKRLKKKKDNLHDESKIWKSVPIPTEVVSHYDALVERVNALISHHNDRVDSHSEEVTKAASQLELHTIAKTLKDQSYFRLCEEKKAFDDDLTDMNKNIAQIEADIESKQAALQDTSAAVKRINDILADFFGEAEIYLTARELDSDDVEYVLNRRKEPAKFLSEGEKSIVALVYFLTKLEEAGCAKDKAIIVIDDPIDSQDGVFLFQTFGLVKRRLANAGQVIILTHNYEFFNLCRDWLKEKKHRDDARLYLLSRDNGANPVSVTLGDLPGILRNYKSEYQYLFCRLYRYKNGKQALDEPLVANISRKLLEYFSTFKWCCASTEDFTSIVNSRFADANQFEKGIADFIVKFVHEYSHGQDPTRPVTASVLEAAKVAEKTLEFIKLADPEHYKALKKLSESVET